LTVAILTGARCLVLDGNRKRSRLKCEQEKPCDPDRYTLLETFLTVNEILYRTASKGLALQPMDHNLYETRWSVRKVEPGVKFSLGERGALRVIDILHPSKHHPKSGLIVEWKDLTPSRGRDFTQAARLQIGITPTGLCHREYVRSDPGDKTSPLLIHVVSHLRLAAGS